MTCPACLAFAAAERAAIEGNELPPHALDGCECADDAPLDVLFVAPWSFHTRPQVGIDLHLTWRELARWLSQPTVGSAKDQAGAWSPALYQGGVRRKAALVAIGALVVDVDQGGDVDVAAELVGAYDAIVHETFSSTAAAPRCRIVLRLLEAVDVAIYERTHKVVRAHLAGAGFAADECAKDASRLSYAPVRLPRAGYRFRVTEGRPLDAHACVTAQPPPPPRTAPKLPDVDHLDAYIAGAFRRAAAAVATASEGMRHYTLNREAHALARLDVTEGQIADALLPAFVAVAGKHREAEGVRTIGDAVRARRSAA